LIDDHGKEISGVFGDHEEQTIISLSFDQPELMLPVMSYLEESHFRGKHTSWVFSVIKEYYNKHGIILNRGMCLDIVKGILTVNDPHKEILAIIKKPLDSRESIVTVSHLIEWAKKKAYGVLFSKESLEAYERGQFDEIEGILEKARKIVSFQGDSMYFFDNFDIIFTKNKEEKFTTSFPRLDAYINDGGPTRGDVFCWLAPTGSGKSLLLINCGAASILHGQHVLHITLELSKQKVSERYAGVFTGEWIRRRFEDDVKKRMLRRFEDIKRTYHKQLIIDSYPPYDITADVIHAKLDYLRRIEGIDIKILIVDYLELLLPRDANRGGDNDYGIQKHIANDLCRLAKKEQVLIFTAMQTNRGGGEATHGDKNSHGESKMIELGQTAESFGKTMPVDYIVSINQNKGDIDDGRRDPKNHDAVTEAQCRFYIVKNRNGPRWETIGARINFETMKATEHSG
jgi:replicative DNA helicase